MDPRQNHPGSQSQSSRHLSGMSYYPTYPDGQNPATAAADQAAAAGARSHHLGNPIVPNPRPPYILHPQYACPTAHYGAEFQSSYAATPYAGPLPPAVLMHAHYGNQQHQVAVQMHQVIGPSSQQPAQNCNPRSSKHGYPQQNSSSSSRHASSRCSPVESTRPRDKQPRREETNTQRVAHLLQRTGRTADHWYYVETGAKQGRDWHRVSSVFAGNCIATSNECSTKTQATEEAAFFALPILDSMLDHRRGV